jgi:hypothetical protein
MQQQQQQQTEIDTVLEKWDECRQNMDLLEKKIKRYRQTVENFLQKNNLDQYENSKFKVKRSVQQRSLLTKKMVPKDVWETYSLPQRVEFLLLTDKSKRKNSSNPLKKKVS